MPLLHCVSPIVCIDCVHLTFYSVFTSHHWSDHFKRGSISAPRRRDACFFYHTPPTNTILTPKNGFGEYFGLATYWKGKHCRSLSLYHTDCRLATTWPSYQHVLLLASPESNLLFPFQVPTTPTHPTSSRKNHLFTSSPVSACAAY